MGETIKVIDETLGKVADFSLETEALIEQEKINSPNFKSKWGKTRQTHDIQKLLTEINALLEKKKEYHNKAHIAYQRKMFAVASYYGEEASKFFDEIDELRKDIVDYIISTR